jgi:hypothetical protein
MSNNEWQQKANAKQNEKRKGTPTYSAVRLSDIEEKTWLDSVIEKHGGTKKDSLIRAYELLEKELGK